MKWIALTGAVFVLASVAVGTLLLAARDSPNPDARRPPAGPYRGTHPPAGIQAPDFTLRNYLGQVDYLIDTVRQLRPIWRAYAILPAVDTGNSDSHSADVRIFDRHGEWVSTLHTAVDLTPANAAHDIRTALRRSS